MMATLDHPLNPFVDPLPTPSRRVITEPTRLTIRMQTALHRFHRDLPPSPVWTYDGHLPGPTIEVRRGVPLEVLWENRLEGTLPVIVTVAPDHAVDGIPVQCVPGRSGGEPDPSAAALSGFSAVHLHGAVTHASSDGWAENLAAPGQQALDAYPNDQRATMLWYHDHVMGVTRLHVYAGLAGLWIVRDDRERELELPEGPPYELPLLLTDRNFDTSTGSLTGRLLHKTDPEVMECFGPFTTVNGTVWPLIDVEPTTYRFRVLNASNARSYRLVLLRDGRPDHARITQIGTEGGLLLASASLPPQGLTLASAERADLLVDFSDLSPGAELTLWNTARAPFDGTFADPATAGTSDLDGLLPYPEVLRLRVVDGRRDRSSAPSVLATDLQRVTRDELAGCTVRSIALVEQEAHDEAGPPMLTMRELIEDPTADEPVITVIDPANDDERATKWRAIASRFEDTVTFFPILGQPEIWRLMNLTGDTHPIHVHLTAFQVLDRQPARVEIPDDGITASGTSATVRIGAMVDDGISHALDDNERGLKDTVRVNPNEVVDIAVRFEVFAGRYMYHCHILEHEDHDMMRPFVVMPAELMPFMGMHGGHDVSEMHHPDDRLSDEVIKER
jgi:FtsP/CotA-like multicopper oxidase with cupredoxin domain